MKKYLISMVALQLILISVRAQDILQQYIDEAIGNNLVLR